MTSINLGTKGAYSITGGTWVADNDYVTNFKITGTYSGYINVAASEGIMGGGALSGAERTTLQAITVGEYTVKLTINQGFTTVENPNEEETDQPAYSPVK